MKFNEEFQVGKNDIGSMSSRFTGSFSDSEFVSVFMPTYQKIPRNMTDAEIESDLNPDICTLGDVLALLDNTPKECKDGYGNLFYFPSFVTNVIRQGSYWDIYAWDRDENAWISGTRVFSPATAKPSGAVVLATCPLTLESLHARLSKIERIINPELLK